MTVYVLIANDEEKVKECIVLEDLDDANKFFNKLKTIYGGENVAMFSRMVNDIPYVRLKKALQEIKQ